MTPIEKLNVRIKIDEAAGCWLWQGTLTDSGYGIALHEEKRWRVHRLVYTLLVGPIPQDATTSTTCASFGTAATQTT